MSIAEMADRGHSKLTRKAGLMKTNWEAAKPRMKSNYAAVGFGPTVTSNYNAGIDAASYRVDPDKWKRNWVARMSV